MYMYDIIYKTILSDFLSVCMYLHGTYSFGEKLTHSTKGSPKYTMVEVGDPTLFSWLSGGILMNTGPCYALEATQRKWCP
jgi:hypothetical protein